MTQPSSAIEIAIPERKFASPSARCHGSTKLWVIASVTPEITAVS